MDNPKVFYHIACMGNWENVVNEQLSQLAKAKLTNVSCGILGNQSQINKCLELANLNNVNLTVEFHNENLKLFEIPTLTCLYNWAKSNPNKLVTYIHTKGVSNPKDQARQYWRKIMMKWIVEDYWENEQIIIKNGLDVIGFYWDNKSRGNFWTANTNWINKLPTPKQYQTSMPVQRYQNNPEMWKRMAAEYWIGSKPNLKIKSLGGPILDLFDEKTACKVYMSLKKTNQVIPIL